MSQQNTSTPSAGSAARRIPPVGRPVRSEPILTRLSPCPDWCAGQHGDAYVSCHAAEFEHSSDVAKVAMSGTLASDDRECVVGINQHELIDWAKLTVETDPPFVVLTTVTNEGKFGESLLLHTAEEIRGVMHALECALEVFEGVSVPARPVPYL